MTRPAPRQGMAAAKYALARVGHLTAAAGYCQIFTRTCSGTPSSGGTAAIAWRNAHKMIHETDGDKIPGGAAVYFTGGSHGYGHACVSYKRGYVVSTDWAGARTIAKARIRDIGPRWGLQLVGYIMIDGNDFVLREKKVKGVSAKDVIKALESKKGQKLIADAVLGSDSVPLPAATLKVSAKGNKEWSPRSVLQRLLNNTEHTRSHTNAVPKLAAQTADLRKAVAALPEAATKAQIETMLDNLDATIKLIVNTDSEDNS